MVRLRVMCQKRTQGRVARGCGRHRPGRAGEEERGEEREEPMATNTQVRYHMKLRQEGFSMHIIIVQGGKGGSGDLCGRCGIVNWPLSAVDLALRVL